MQDLCCLEPYLCKLQLKLAKMPFSGKKQRALVRLADVLLFSGLVNLRVNQGGKRVT